MTFFIVLEDVLTNSKLEWLPGSQAFYNKLLLFANRVGWKIRLLSVNKSPQDKAGKEDWCQKNLGLSKTNIKLIPNAKAKIKFANPLSILIDNKEDFIDSFVYAGGTAIVFDCAEKAGKRFNLLEEAIEDLEARGKKEDINNPSKLLDARLRIIFQKAAPEDSWRNEYKSALNHANGMVLQAFEHRDFNKKTAVDSARTNEKFSAIKNFSSDLKSFIKQYNDIEDTVDLYLGSNVCDFFYKDLFKGALSVYKRKDYTEQIITHLKSAHNLDLFSDMTQEEASSILTFILLTIIGKFMQEKYIVPKS